MQTIIIKQPPVAQPRPRVTKWGTFDPVKEQKSWAKLQISQQVSHCTSEPLSLTIKFYLQIPKSTSKKKQQLMLSNKIKHIKRKDLDNLAKFTLDAMNNIVYHDDGQIWQLHLEKRYTLDNPRTEIVVNR